jgi:hypothetical protein
MVVLSTPPTVEVLALPETASRAASVRAVVPAKAGMASDMVSAAADAKVSMFVFIDILSYV